MVRNSLTVIENIGKDEAKLNRTFACLETVDMSFSYLFGKTVDNLLKGLNTGSKLCIIF